jgi:hypothetical protein
MWARRSSGSTIMARPAVTYGFGRIANSRPSPYSPMYRQGAAAMRRRTGRARRKVVRVLAAAVVLGALVGVAAYLASTFVRDTEPVSTTARPVEPSAPLSDEALRLSRSAIAVGRYTPRRGS